MNNIKLIIYFIWLISASQLCYAERATLKQGKLQLASKEQITVALALSAHEQTQGLSGVQAEDFKDNQGMLFVYARDRRRQFWMPDTYFDLDIFFLDKDLQVIDVDRDVPHYIGRDNPAQIPRAKAVFCRHVLEMKADSPLAQKIKIGDQLTWLGPDSLESLFDSRSRDSRQPQ